jgi:hypothetical protein
MVARPLELLPAAAYGTVYGIGKYHVPWMKMELQTHIRDGPDATGIRHYQRMFGILDARTGWIKNEEER